MVAIPVIYAQCLVGERWQYYGKWTKYLPVNLVERLGSRLPAKQLWNELIPCGDQRAELRVFAGPSSARHAVPADTEQRVPVVYSRNLGVPVEFVERWRGRELSLGLLRRILPALTRELELFGDRLRVGVAVAPWESPFWVSGLEPYARAVTVFLRRNERGQSLGTAGTAIRHCTYDSGRADVHVLLVSPERMNDVGTFSMRRGTVVISTDGQPMAMLHGSYAMDLSLAEELGLPEYIWAAREDQLPVLEKVVLSAFQTTFSERWPTHPIKRIETMDTALAWSSWSIHYRLQPV